LLLSNADRLRDVLRDKFQWDGYSLQDARGKLIALADFVSPTETLSVVKEDPADDGILECACAAKSDFIVSEDKDLLRLGQFGVARIVSVRVSSFWRSHRGQALRPAGYAVSKVGIGGCLSAAIRVTAEFPTT
jgi:hypothetical protein